MALGPGFRPIYLSIYLSDSVNHEALWEVLEARGIHPKLIIIIIIIINRRSGITSHTSHGHKTGTRSMQPVRSVPLGGPVVS